MLTFTKEVENIKNKGLLRELKFVTPGSGNDIVLNGKKLTAFCSNDYLGLSRHPEVIESALSALEKYGAGAGASRLISGNNFLYEKLESEISGLKNTESSLIFSSGYHTNIGLIPAITGRHGVIFADKLCHASIIDGCRLSGSKILRFKHNNIGHLESLLEKTEAENHVIITETLFSMDGDLCPSEEILELGKHYNCVIIFDEAHSTGVIDAAEYVSCEAIIRMGTLSKAAGSIGGFAAASKTIIDLLINKARPFIFSTALPPASLAAAAKAVEIIKKDNSLKLRLAKNISRTRNGLADLELKALGDEKSPIIPLLTGSPGKATKASKRLAELGVFIPAVRPPAVEIGKSRLRITVNALHEENQIGDLLEKISTVKKEGLL